MIDLADMLRREIELEGPIGVDRWMSVVLGHPTAGYYATRDPFGAAGDFITAPEISQVFGELIGLWCAAVWQGMGAPSPVRLVELGPGRGTLMADLLRAARVLPAFRAALDVHLVETSPVLRERQREAVSDVSPTWHDALESVPAGPLLLIANELLDALPIRQFVRTAEGWRERVIGLGDDGAFRWGLAAAPPAGLGFPAAPVGDLVEVSVAGLALVREIAVRVRRDGGAALLIDYGSSESGTGDTLQAVRAHAPTDPLAEPGAADLTAHVDFAALAQQARAAGAAVHGPVTQGVFLQRLGIAERLERLTDSASPEVARDLALGVERLTATGPRAMGDLFKVLALTAQSQPVPPAFESAPA